ncbi:putative omega-amidase, chloroplastic [Cocos nucifera]|uniref:Putative omega-amidase, chloroplastic n=1 Tax=Cocos nucifera TaxID=13894 RepID=A0A8K0NB65_COCNU|nr:putative omega-amidase, chloroplastic [Cocos nucifera]
MRVGLGFLSSSAALLTADLFRSSHLPLKRLLLPSISPNRIPARPPPPSRQPLAFAFFSAMASTHKPEDARVPPALHLTTPPFKIGLCQLAVTADKERNIVHARKAIEEAAGKGAKLVLLPFKIGLCQLAVTADKERNIVHARKAIEEAAGKGAKLVLLPVGNMELPYSNDSFPIYAEDIEAGGDADPSFSMLSDVACSLQITIVGGSIPECSGDCLYNTCCVFGAYGNLKGKHRKVHYVNGSDASCI